MTDGEIVVEFTDRYGGRKPPWNYCRGGCEAMGVVPVKLAGWGAMEAVTAAQEHLLDLARAAHERGDGHDDSRCDGWHFVQCPDCGGSGEISKLRALRYLPRKIRQTLRFVWRHGVRGYSRPSWMTQRQQLVMVLRIAIGHPAT